MKEVKKLRKKTGLSQSDFSKETGINQGYLSRLESGKLGITVVKLKELAKKAGFQVIITFRKC